MRIELALNGQKLLYLFIEEGVNFLSQFIVYGFALDEVIDSLRENLVLMMFTYQL